MKKAKNISVKVFGFIKKHKIFLLFASYSTVAWSWLLLVDVARLSSSAVVGMGMQVVSLLIVVFLSAFIYTKGVKFLFSTLKRNFSYIIILKIITWWAAIELFVSWAVSIIWYGSGAKIDSILPFTSISHLVMWSPLRYLSRFFGFYGLSAITFTLLTLIALRSLRKYFFKVSSVVVALTLLAWGLYKSPNGSSINTVTIAERLGERLPYVVSPANGSLVVFPEYGFDGVEGEDINTRVAPQGIDQKVYFISSRLISEDDKLRNQLIAGSTKDGFEYKIEKSRLIPAGEYLPYSMVAILRLSGAEEVLSNFRLNRLVDSPGNKNPKTLLKLGDFQVGAGICSSIVAPEDYRKLARDKAQLFTNSASLEIFRGSRVYGWQHQAMAQFMATANARSFLQSANNGPAFAFDSNGKRLFYEKSPQAIGQQIVLNNRRTPYSFLGEYVALVGLLWMGIEVLRGYKSRILSKKKLHKA